MNVDRRENAGGDRAPNPPDYQRRATLPAAVREIAVGERAHEIHHQDQSAVSEAGGESLAAREHGGGDPAGEAVNCEQDKESGAPASQSRSAITWREEQRNRSRAAAFLAENEAGTWLGVIARA